jgi:predicted membrane protein
MRRNGNLWWGIVLIVLGVMFMFDNANMIDFGQILRTWWPAIFVIWGVSILLNRSCISISSPGAGTVNAQSAAGEVKEIFNDRHETPEGERLNYSSVFGDLSLRPASANFKGGSVSTVFGDTTIDLTAATLADGENTLKISGVFGDVSIMLGPSMAYVISASSLFGSIQAAGQKRDGFSPNLVIQSPEFSSATKQLSIQVSHVFGDITLTR